MFTPHIVNAISLVIGLAAAIAWAVSAAVSVPGPPQLPGFEKSGFELTGDVNQVIHALQKAGRYNRIAAGLTALATLAQMFAAYFGGGR